jgi:KipI family sensor histidine kinase inhibitor
VTDAAVRFESFGDAALLATLGEELDPDLNLRALGVASAIARLRVDDPRLGRAVAAHASVLVPFDPVALPRAEAAAIVLNLVGAVERAADEVVDAGTLHHVPVRYGGPDGPDLDDICERLGLRPNDVVELHAGAEYRVYFLGFAPGFGYLGPVPPELEIVRLATPRERVPAGSVGIAGRQTAVYPFALPGGWQLIGRTETPMWDVRRDPPALLAPGDRVRFVPFRDHVVTAGTRR